MAKARLQVSNETSAKEAAQKEAEDAPMVVHKGLDGPEYPEADDEWLVTAAKELGRGRPAAPRVSVRGVSRFL